MPLPDVDPTAIPRMLEEQYHRTTATAQHAPASEADEAARNLVAFLKGLTESGDGLRKLALFLREDPRPILESEQFLPKESREVMTRIAASSREWAPRYAGLAIPEAHPLAIGLTSWIRPYNDAVRDATRALLDLAVAFDQRVAEEEAEDAVADAWAAQQPPRDPNEPTVPWAEVKRRLAAKRTGT